MGDDGTVTTAVTAGTAVVGGTAAATITATVGTADNTVTVVGGPAAATTTEAVVDGGTAAAAAAAAVTDCGGAATSSLSVKIIYPQPGDTLHFKNTGKGYAPSHVSYFDFECVLSTEDCLGSIGKLKFLDSLAFITGSLSSLAKTHIDSASPLTFTHSIYSLELTHYCSLPGYSYDCFLKSSWLLIDTKLLRPEIARLTDDLPLCLHHRGISKEDISPFSRGLFQILELAKYSLYHFWYRVLKNHYSDRVQLVYSDTDSFIFTLLAEDVFNEMGKEPLSLWMDTSNFPETHPLYDPSKKGVLGLLKSEVSDKHILEVVAMATTFNTKRGLSAFDDKRFYLNKYTSLAYGHPD
ncbi:uncharacterized protein, partial [Procambarus clarkii]|uniref:uncharacterized protein n=1 Tax=Procambarus clarkii TaxID=6728 RepID=UPI003743D74F